MCQNMIRFAHSYKIVEKAPSSLRVGFGINVCIVKEEIPLFNQQRFIIKMQSWPLCKTNIYVRKGHKWLVLFLLLPNTAHDYSRIITCNYSVPYSIVQLTCHPFPSPLPLSLSLSPSVSLSLSKVKYLFFHYNYLEMTTWQCPCLENASEIHQDTWNKFCYWNKI